ncbi:MAG: AMP-binding protein [Candidatus Diapherotrites archaeon]
MMAEKPNMESYEKTCREFKWVVPEFYNFGFDTIDKWAEKKPEKTALISVESDCVNHKKHSFNDLKEQSNRFANVLLSLGVKKGDRVLLMLPRIPEWYFCVIGAIKAGAIFIPTTIMSTEKDLEFRLDKSGASIVVTDTENADKIDAVAGKAPSLKRKVIVGGKKDGWISFDEEMAKAPKEIKNPAKTKSSDPMLVYFTSGTESYPKMVLHEQKYALGHEVTARFAQDLTEEDVHWTIADTGWAKTAWGKLFGQWIVGCTVLQFNQKGKFDADTALGIIQRFNVTTFCAPPTVYRMMILKEGLKNCNFGNLRHCMSAGEPLNPEVIKVWKEATGTTIHDFYGQTETVCLISNYLCMPIRHGSMGKPTPGHVVDIVGEEGNPVPVEKEGLIAVRTEPIRPPGLFREYWQDKEKNESVFRKGWYFTGDKAYKDKDGYFWFVGRADDVIKASGYRIGPFEVESVLIEHPAVAEAAVVGHPDPVRGTVVKAFIILAPGFKGSDKLTGEIQEFVKKQTAPYKYPRIIEYVKELPKTISGKIRRAELRKR